MSGHSKWSSIKHKKAATDSKRGKMFTKIIKELTVAARSGGGDPESNPRLRLAIQRAKDANMPKDNISKAIKKGTGELPGVNYEEITYEGYGPKGVAILIDVLTDNKNRTSADVRSTFTKYGGSMAGLGAVSWMFKKKGFILVNRDKAEEDALMDIIIEAGAEDMTTGDDSYEITTSITEFEKVKNALAEKNIETESAELTKIPSSSVVLQGDDAKGVLKLVDVLEDNDDVQNVYANFDIPDDIA